MTPPPHTRPRAPDTVVAIATDAMSSALLARAATELERQQAVTVATVSSGPPALVRLVVAGTPTSVVLRRLGARVVKMKDARRSRRVGVGSARTADDADARAITALDLGSSLHSSPEVALYTDVIPLEVIQLSGRVRELAAIIAPVVAHDARCGTRLRQMLECLCATGGSIAATGRALRLHRHTVAQRLVTAERLLGLPSRTEPGRLTIELALAAHRLAQRDEDAATVAIP